MILPCLPPPNSRSLPCQACVRWYRSQSLPHFSFALVMRCMCIHGLQQRAGEDRFCPAEPLLCEGCALPWGQAAVLHQRSVLVHPPNAAVLPAMTLLPRDHPRSMCVLQVHRVFSLCLGRDVLLPWAIPSAGFLVENTQATSLLVKQINHLRADLVDVSL